VILLDIDMTEEGNRLDESVGYSEELASLIKSGKQDCNNASRCRFVSSLEWSDSQCSSVDKSGWW
jgi:hypothetical protein